MKAEHIKQKVVGFCKKIGKRNFMIAGALVLIAAAVCINVAIVASDKDQGFDYSQGSSMDGQGTTQAPGGSSTDSTATGDSYFSSVQVSRQRTRDEAIEVLQAVVDNASSTETAKNEALAEINKLALVMETEANIESLIVAKGFEECVAVISGDSASIVVKSEGLLASEISQINEIVYEQSGISPVNVKIIER